MGLKSLAADLLTLSEAQGAPQIDEEPDTRLLARAAVDYVLSEAESDAGPEDIGVAITLAVEAVSSDAGADAEIVLEQARTYLRRILAATA